MRLFGRNRDDALEHNGDSPYPTALRDVPANPRERTEEIERLVDKVVEDHREALERLADE